MLVVALVWVVCDSGCDDWLALLRCECLLLLPRCPVERPLARLADGLKRAWSVCDPEVPVWRRESRLILDIARPNAEGIGSGRGMRSWGLGV